MKKFIVLAVILGSAFTASAASAQSYYSYNTGVSYGSIGCVSLARDLSYGMRGSDVSTLQSFLVSRNYPGSGSWMVTGYFGRATETAVQNFQREKGLAQTGIADSVTRAAMCLPGQVGTSVVNPFPTNPTYPIYPSYPTYPTYPTYPGYPTYSQVQITSLSTNSAAQGSPVTIYGTGFDYTNNTVYVGSNPISNVISTNGTQLTFTVPVYISGTVQVYVANNRGQSNALSLTIVPYTQPCGTYPYNTNCGSCLYPYTNCNQGMPNIQFLSPAQGAVGTSVTIYGSGFSTTNNTVRFGQGIIAGISSFDGRSLTFTVPSQLVGYSSQQVVLSTYQVSVQNSAGYTSNTMPFTVTSLGSVGAPTIQSITGPSSLSAGTQGSWNVQVYNTPQSYTNYVTLSVTWGDENLYGSSLSPNQTSYSQGSQTFTFTHTYLQPGTYTIRFTVMNSSGQSNSSTATVVVSGSNTGSLSLSSVNPSSGRVGMQVTLTGSGFSSTDNTVRFGIGGTQHVPSFNGSTIYYTIPQYVSPCDIVTSGQTCAQYFQQVSPGTYQIWVTNSSGSTSQLTFNVTN